MLVQSSGKCGYNLSYLSWFSEGQCWYKVQENVVTICLTFPGSVRVSVGTKFRKMWLQSVLPFLVQ